jgi:hypothetical protein
MKPTSNPIEHTITLTSKQTFFDGETVVNSVTMSKNVDDMGLNEVSEWLNNQGLRGIGYWLLV